MDNILTKHQLDLLWRISNGESYKEIAFNLNISEKTIKNELYSIRRKLNITNTVQAILFAFKNGLLEFNNYDCKSILDDVVIKHEDILVEVSNNYYNTHLSNKENSVLNLVKHGYTDKQIASELYISYGSVKRYIQVLFDKFKVDTRCKLLARVFGMEVKECDRSYTY